MSGGIKLYDYQLEALDKMRNGCILNGGVGSGKSRTGLAFYFKQCGGEINPEKYVAMTHPLDLYVITTAKKRDSGEWLGDMVPFLISPESKDTPYKHQVIIDSWNNIGKYSDIQGAFFIFDEDRVTGYGAWVKSFLKIAKNNQWIILSATPGDTYMDYMPVFVANGFYKNKSEFVKEHVIYNSYVRFPQIDRYVGTERLNRLRRRVLVEMNYRPHTTQHHEDIWCDYDVTEYKKLIKDRWNPWEDEPIKNASEFCYSLRRMVNASNSRLLALLDVWEKKRRVIVFYNFDYELEAITGLCEASGIAVGQWNGHKHEEIPSDLDNWMYLVQYNAGSEGWNYIGTDTIVFFSQNYSYKMMVQAAGRIDRQNTPFTDLYYYHFISRSGIDLAIKAALGKKKKFNETKYVAKMGFDKPEKMEVKVYGTKH